MCAVSCLVIPQRLQPVDGTSAEFVYSISTVAGISGVTGCGNGFAPTATFNFPFGVVSDRRGSVVVADAHNHVIRRIVRNAEYEIQYLQVCVSLSG